MDGKEKIIAKILEDAQQKCDEIISNANSKADSIVKESEQTVETQRQALEVRIAEESKEIMRNTLSNAQLDARKYRLAKKQQLIDDVYDKCFKHLASLDKKKYTDFVKKLLTKYAEKGETVVIAEKDSKVITQEMLDSLKKSLKLSERRADITGGVILEGNGYEKNLSFDSIVRYIRESTEMAVAKVLFGE